MVGLFGGSLYYAHGHAHGAVSDDEEVLTRLKGTRKTDPVLAGDVLEGLGGHGSGLDRLAVVAVPLVQLQGQGIIPHGDRRDVDLTAAKGRRGLELDTVPGVAVQLVFDHIAVGIHIALRFLDVGRIGIHLADGGKGVRHILTAEDGQAGAEVMDGVVLVGTDVLPSGGVAPVAHGLGGVAGNVLHVEKVLPRRHLVEEELQGEVIGEVHEVLGGDGGTAQGLIVGGVPLEKGHTDGADVVVPAGGGQGEPREGDGGVELHRGILSDLLGAAGGGFVTEGGADIGGALAQGYAYGGDLHGVEVGTVTAHGDADGMLPRREADLRLGGVGPIPPVHALDGVPELDRLPAVHAHGIGARGRDPAEGKAEVVVPCFGHVDLELKPVIGTDAVEVGGAEILFQVEVSVKGGALVGVGVDLTEDDLGDFAVGHGGGPHRRDGQNTESAQGQKAGQSGRRNSFEQLHRDSFPRVFGDYSRKNAFTIGFIGILYHKNGVLSTVSGKVDGIPNNLAGE